MKVAYSSLHITLKPLVSARESRGQRFFYMLSVLEHFSRYNSLIDNTKKGRTYQHNLILNDRAAILCGPISLSQSFQNFRSDEDLCPNISRFYVIYPFGLAKNIPERLSSDTRHNWDSHCIGNPLRKEAFFLLVELKLRV